MSTTQTEFNECEVVEAGIKVGDSASVVSLSCIDKIEYTITKKKKVKKCGGVNMKTIARLTGEGTVKLTAFYPKATYEAMQGMTDSSLKTGIASNHTGSILPKEAITACIRDEEGNEKLQAYPNCMIINDISVAIDNSSEDVVAREIEFAYSPDANGIGLYECLVSALPSGVTKTTWMNSFSADNLKATVSNG